MQKSPFHLAALAVVAINGMQVVGVRGPHVVTPDFQYSGVLDSRGKHWIVKYPLHTHAATVIEAEASLAPALLEQLRAGYLPFDVMRPAGFARVAEGRAMVYLAPVGKARDFTKLDATGANELGRTLAAIHQLPVETISNSGMPVYDAPAVQERLLAEVNEAVSTGSIPGILRRRWLNALENPELWNFPTRVVHGDVAAEQFLWSEGTVSCVLGFGQAHVGDPAEDFTSLVAGVEESLFNAVLTSYRNALADDIDEHFFTRTILLSELAVARWLMFGIRTADSSIIAEAEAMLAEIAAEIEADPDLVPGPTWNVDQVNTDLEITNADDAGFSSTDADDTGFSSTNPDDARFSSTDADDTGFSSTNPRP
ncbi:MAG: phosphotransferase [Actinomycetaceae bacterium]|nr:phosphotransferase [Actinomycetaceae bacterium]